MGIVALADFTAVAGFFWLLGGFSGGPEGNRTPDLLIANETRYQLRHSPKEGSDYQGLTR